MDLLDELDSFFALAMGPAPRVARTVRVCEPLGLVVRQAAVVVEEKLVEPVVAAPTRADVVWPECLACGAEIASGVRGRYRGLCRVCDGTHSESARVWYRRLVDRWRKWSLTRAHEAFYLKGPDPWQVALFAFGRVMVGFETAPGSEGTPRACLDDLLGISSDELTEICRGRGELPDAAKARLAEHGQEWFTRWCRDDPDVGLED